MKLIRYTLPALMLSVLFIFPALTQAEESPWDKAEETTSKSWEITKKGAEEAVEWGREKSVDAWNATRQGAADASRWSREKASEVWDAAREGTVDALEALKGRDEELTKEAPQDSRIF
ncbi:hypothetical protein MNBD_GAMMA20-348 [hydrothermal vent metagenome]|uniref:Uncharacterized protein n=1 Tax=hydrothermal vent metagenome TaxID=652676 RepID=A0A3B1B8F8_9ZZZZ